MELNRLVGIVVSILLLSLVFYSHQRLREHSFRPSSFQFVMLRN